MNNLEPQQILRFLAEGIDPISMNPLPEESPLQKPYLIRAFYAAHAALDLLAARAKRKSSLPGNTGKSWSALEDEMLLAAYEAGTSLKLLAADHQRSSHAVRLRLAKLGKGEFLNSNSSEAA